jgi:hypothetical protein
MMGIPILGEILDAMQNDDQFALTFTLMLAFVVGVFALVCYAPLALVLKKKWRHWRVRAVRMWTFGLMYAALLLLMSAPRTAGALVDPLYYDDIFLPNFVNPFFAMSMLVTANRYAQYHTYGPVITHTPVFAIAGTLIFAIGAAYLLKQLSNGRFEALRRS